jgi:tetratricopeptide (TPR) repeat protein
MLNRLRAMARRLGRARTNKTKSHAANRARLQRPQWLTLPTVESTSNSMRAVVVNLVLLAAILLAAPLIATQAARDQILLEPISVPAALQVTGLTPEVAANRLNDGLLQIIREADTGKSSINVVPEGQRVTFDIPESGISVDALISYARKFFNLHETVIGGEFRCGDPVCTPALVSLRLRVHGRELAVIERPPMRRTTEAVYWRDAASKVMEELDPFMALAADVNQRPINAATIARRLIASGHADAKWAHNVLGNIRRNTGDADDALAEYQASLDIDGAFVPALANMAGTLAEQGRFDEAVPFLDRLAAVDGNSALEAEVRGDLARFQDQVDLARDWYAKAFERNPLNARYQSKAANMLINKGRTEEGVALARAAFALSPDDPLPLALLAGHFAGQGDFLSLEKLYRDAAEFSPENAEFQAQHSNLLMINEDYAGALERIDRALLVDEGNVAYRLDRAEVLAALGRHEDALIDLDLALQREPSNAEVIYARAMSLGALDRQSESIAAYRQYLTLEPEGPFAEVAKAMIGFGERPPDPPAPAPVDAPPAIGTDGETGS